MTDIAWPSGLYPERLTWSLVRNQQRATNPYSNTVQRNDRGGDLWACRIEMPALSSTKSGIMAAWLDEISKAGNAGLVPVFQNDPADVESGTTEFRDMNRPWAQQPTFSLWTATALIAAPYLSGNDLVLRPTGSPPGSLTRAFTVTANVPYFFEIDIPPQPFPAGVFVGNAGFASLYFDNRSAPVVGRVSGIVYSSNTSITIGLSANTAFQPSLVSSVSLSRCYIAQAAALAGAGRVVINGSNPANAAPANIVRALKAGQHFAIQTSEGMELKRAVLAADTVLGQSVNGVSTGGLGNLVFSPALRGAVSTGAVVTSARPSCRMILNEAVSSMGVQPTLRAGFSFDLIEDPT